MESPVKTGPASCLWGQGAGRDPREIPRRGQEQGKSLLWDGSLLIGYLDGVEFREHNLGRCGRWGSHGKATWLSWLLLLLILDETQVHHGKVVCSINRLGNRIPMQDWQVLQVIYSHLTPWLAPYYINWQFWAFQEGHQLCPQHA